MNKSKKIAFLDRDGVINSSKPRNGYIGYLKDFKWVPGAKKAIQFLKTTLFLALVIKITELKRARIKAIN